MDIQNSKNNSVLFIEDLLFYQDVFLLENSNNKPKDFTLNRFVKIEDNQPKYIYDKYSTFENDNRCSISDKYIYELYILYCKYNNIFHTTNKEFLSNIQCFNIYLKKNKKVRPSGISFYDIYHIWN
jgi:hypothetical protein